MTLFTDEDSVLGRKAHLYELSFIFASYLPELGYFVMIIKY